MKLARYSVGRNFSAHMHRASEASCYVVPALALLVGLYRLHLGWDDGAITAAFARTYRLTGRFALTPLSVQVEGFSSLLWMLILAAGNTVFHSVDAMLAWTKIASAIAFSLSLFALAKLARRSLPDDLASLAVLLLAFVITPFTEVANGMEMNLYMFLTVKLADVLSRAESSPPRKWLLAGLLSCALLLTRFETPYLLCFLYGGLALASVRKRGLLLLASANILFFALVELWRQHRFGGWLPNTIYAKKWPPYSPVGWKHQVLSRSLATWEILVVLGFPILLLGVLWLTGWLSLSISARARNRSPLVSPVWLSMSAGGILLGLLMGRNWGHPGRMILAFLPFLVLTVVSGFYLFAERTGLRLGRLTAVLLLGQASVWAVQASLVARGNSVPYAVVERTGLAVDALRVDLHQPTLSALIPDIGASALCCVHLNVMDSALLANPALAKSGYKNLKAFVDTERPEVIETHQPWTIISNVYGSHMLDGYEPVEVAGMYLFVRSDLYQQLLKDGYPERSVGPSNPGCISEAEAYHMKSIDLRYLVMRGGCIVISKAELAAPSAAAEQAAWGW